VVNYCYEQIDTDDSYQDAKAAEKSRRRTNDHCLLLLRAWLVLSLIFFDWALISSHGLLWGLLIFVGAYSSNRKYGYTRAFMRYDYYKIKVKILIDELTNNLESIEVIHQKLHIVCIEAKGEAYKDVVGDYIEVNNSALKSLSSKYLQ
jgi:hypothetical protein